MSYFIWLFSTRLGIVQLALIGVIPIMLLLLADTAERQLEEEEVQIQLVKNMECSRLGNFILEGHVLYNVQDYADDQWMIRCHGGILP